MLMYVCVVFWKRLYGLCPANDARVTVCEQAEQAIAQQMLKMLIAERIHGSKIQVRNAAPGALMHAATRVCLTACVASSSSSCFPPVPNRQ